MVYLMLIIQAVRRVKFYRHGDAVVAFTRQIIVIKAVVGAVHIHPEVGFTAFRVVEVIDNHLGHP